MFNFSVFSQEDKSIPKNSQKVSFEKQTKSKELPFFFDDLMFSVGANYGGVFMTKFKDELSYRPGFNMGIEHYQSVEKKVFLNYGLFYSAKNFRHHAFNNIDFRINSIEGLVFLAYEIPAFEEIDIRFLAGVHFNYFASLSSSQPYILDELLTESIHKYQNENLKKLDYGLFVGVSAEKRNYYFRVGTTIGNTNVVRNDQGMYNSIHLSFGYFMFRNMRKF